MNDDLVPIYRAPTIDDAQRVSDKLKEAGVDAFVDNTTAPLYGVTQGPASRIVLVRSPIAAFARQIVNDYRREYHRDESPADRRTEETGLELPTPDRPKDDAPNDWYAADIEAMDADRPGPEAPEVEDMVYDRGDRREVPESDKMIRFGADHDMTEDAEIDTPEADDQPIDKLDLSRDLGEPETGTPSANLRGEAERREREKREGSAGSD